MYTSNLNNLILNSDSYKTSHWVQYPSGSEYLSSYIEARKGDYDVVFFGLQAFIKEYLSTPITHQDIDEAEKVIQAHGLTFNRTGWEHLIEKRYETQKCHFGVYFESGIVQLVFESFFLISRW